ncbi:hypothetical protein LR48_Vigan08g050900 [Vigna angularis]|uniref:Putative plant transposon protein domain-containing protein n=1 Tax=Phaseolus angularis TaxID=3914 RepID=A0A0L9V417_PHAAN|nr:hypothetical protein LR48_Vigan08g050900 [Vigna angularis]
MDQSEFWQAAGQFQIQPQQEWQQQSSLDDVFQQFMQESISTQKSIEASSNIAVVKEFYTNARRLGDHPVEDYLSYVRGHAIRYDPDSINKFLSTEWAGFHPSFGFGESIAIRDSFVDIPRAFFIHSASPPKRLATYPAPANIAVVKEFYNNARRLGDHPVEDYLSYVRGHAIRYDPDSINRFLDTVWVGEQCQFALNMEEGTNFDDVENVLCVPGRHFQRNRNGVVVNIRRIDLTSLAKYSMAFSHANIQPCSNVSDITVSRALLLYCVLRGMSINIGQLAGVIISVPPFESSRKAIDEAYYRQYCGGDEAARPIPPRRPRRGRGPPQGQASAEIHEVEPFQMRDMYMSLIDAQMQSIHRGQVATTEMIIGIAGAAEASAMDDDEDDEKEDAFEDAEDDGQEEDTNDSMG